MTVRDLRSMLRDFPQDARIQKVDLSNGGGETDSEMTEDDWALVEDPKDIMGNPVDVDIVVCCFKEIEEVFPN